MDSQPHTALREKTSRSLDEARRDQVAAVKAMPPLDRVALALSLGRRDALLREMFRATKSFGLVTAPVKANPELPVEDLRRFLEPHGLAAARDRVLALAGSN